MRFLLCKMACCLPWVSILGVVVFRNPNAPIAIRLFVWSLPLSFFLSGSILWRAFVKYPESFRFGAFFTGLMAFIAGILSTFLLLVYEALLHA